MAGEYSDRHVCGVYTTKGRAEFAAKLFHGWVEEFEADTLPNHPRGTTGFVVFMAKDGTADARPTSAELVDAYAGKDDFDRDYRRADDGSTQITQRCRVYLWARNEQHAVKIVNERRAQIISANKWPDDPPPLPPDYRGFASTGLFHPPITETVLGDPIL